MNAKRHVWRRTLTAEQLERRDLLACDFCCHASEAPLGPPDDVEPALTRTQVRSQEQTQTQSQVMVAETNEEPLREIIQTRQSGLVNPESAHQQRHAQPNGDPAQIREQERAQERVENGAHGEAEGCDPVQERQREQERKQEREENGANGGAGDCDPVQERQREQERKQEREENGANGGAEDCDPVQERQREQERKQERVDNGANSEAEDCDPVREREREQERKQERERDGDGGSQGGQHADLAIRVAPHLLVLSAKGGGFTVHTNLPHAEYKDRNLELVLSSPDGDSIFDSDASLRIYADACGNLVVKASGDDVKDAFEVFLGDSLSEKITIVPVVLKINVLDAGGEVENTIAIADVDMRVKT